LVAPRPLPGGAGIPALYNGEGKLNGPTSEAGTLLNARQLVVNFLENHDVGDSVLHPKEWDRTARRARLQLALTYIVTTTASQPLLRVEQELSGGNDPANRETLWTGHLHEAVWQKDHYSFRAKSYDQNGDGEDETVWQPLTPGTPPSSISPS